MNNLFKRYKWLGILTGALLIAAGIIIAVWGIVDHENINIALSIVVATLCFLAGATYLIAGVLTPLSKFFDSLFLYAAFIIAIGVVLLVNRGLMSQVLLYTIAVALIVIGTIYLIRAIIEIVSKIKVTFIILSFLIAALAITAGILCLVYQSQALTVVYVIAGVLLALWGVLEIIASVKK